MELFDKKFVYLEWDDVLDGKEVFTADTLKQLGRHIENDCHKYIVNKHDGDYPFITSDGVAFFAMAYYDPNYKCKVAYERGETIQCRHNKLETWSDCTVPPSWYDNYEYRVKPEAGHSCDTTVQVCVTCKHKDLPYSCSPCNECVDDHNASEWTMWEPRETKRRMTTGSLHNSLQRVTGRHGTVIRVVTLLSMSMNMIVTMILVIRLFLSVPGTGMHGQNHLLKNDRS